MITTIFLVRHGRTVLNAEQRFRGRQDPSLDSQGVRQAQAAAGQLAAAGPEAVYTSPLRRAVQTARWIADAAGTAVSVLPELVDLDYGAWEGLTAEEANLVDSAAYAVFRTDPLHAQPPGGERMSDVAVRTMNSLHDLNAAHLGKTVVAVSHEVPIRLVFASLLGLDGADVWSLDVPTGSVTHLVNESGGLGVIAGPAFPES